jgi:hypothetical protein
MIVLIINEHSVFTLKGEGEAPVAAYRHRPVVLQFPMKGMQLPTGGVHVLRRLGVVQREELLAQPLGMAGVDFGSRSRPEKQCDSLMTEALDHLYSV